MPVWIFNHWTSSVYILIELMTRNVLTSKRSLTLQGYKQMLNEFRTNALPRQFNKTFTEAPDSNIIPDRLMRLNDNFERLMANSDLTNRKWQDLISKHQVL